MNSSNSACRDHLETVLRETLILLCRSVIKCDDKFTLKALVGITIDANEVLLISVDKDVTSRAKEGVVIVRFIYCDSYFDMFHSVGHRTPIMNSVAGVAQQSTRYST